MKRRGAYRSSCTAHHALCTAEYVGGLGSGDTSYEIALARWGFKAALELAAELGILGSEPRAAAWRERLAHMATYSTDPEFGLNVSQACSCSGEGALSWLAGW
jgi:hypothetical protein